MVLGRTGAGVAGGVGCTKEEVPASSKQSSGLVTKPGIGQHVGWLARIVRSMLRKSRM